MSYAYGIVVAALYFASKSFMRVTPFQWYVFAQCRWADITTKCIVAIHCYCCHIYCNNWWYIAIYCYILLYITIYYYIGSRIAHTMAFLLSLSLSLIWIVGSHSFTAFQVIHLYVRLMFSICSSLTLAQSYFCEHATFVLQLQLLSATFFLYFVYHLLL